MINKILIAFGAFMVFQSILDFIFIKRDDNLEKILRRIKKGE